MYFKILAAIALIGAASPAEAKCKYGYKSLGGSVRHEDTRGFTLVAGSTVVAVNADNETRKLSFTVTNPGGAEICTKGPLNSLSCAFEVSNANEGLYKIHIKNSTGEITSYQMTCSDG